MIEPSDSQEAYDFTLAAIEVSERWHIPVLLRVTTRVCHTHAVVVPHPPSSPPPTPNFQRDIKGRVMIPLHARPAHRRLRAKIAEIAEWNETSPLNRILPGDGALGIIASGVCVMHAREAAPNATILKLGMTWPLPIRKIREFAASVKRLYVIEENDPVFADALRAEGIACESKPDSERFGELDVARVRALLDGASSPTLTPTSKPAGKAPQLCEGCPYRAVFQAFRKLDCIVSGDIGCYTLGVLPPFEAMDMMVDMGAAIGMGLGLRHVLPEDQARRVVSVIGDSTFIHSGLTGIAEMVYNRPPTGHVVVILDNLTTAMTGHQEHPGTGRTLEHGKAGRVVLEDAIRGLGIPHVEVMDPVRGDFEGVLRAALDRLDLTVIVARRACLLIAGKIRQYEAAAKGGECKTA
jgi:indolepyruvate ferredoxin oxidoreductase alpha subunit